MKKESPVYYSTSFEELDKFYSEDNNDYKLDVIDYLRLTDKLEEAYNKMRDYCKNDLTVTQKERFNFIQYLYFLQKSDDYNAKKVKRELKKGSKYNNNLIFDFCESGTFNVQLQIFDNNFHDCKSIKKAYRNKILRSDIKYLYLQNFNRSDSFLLSNYINKKIVKGLNKLLNKDKLNLTQVLHIWQVLLLTTNHYLSLKIIKNEFFIDHDLIIKMRDCLIKHTKIYFSTLTKKQKVDFNETIVSAYRLLASNIAISDEEAKKIQQECIDFVDNNSEYLNSNTVFLNTLFKSQNIDKSSILSEIKHILNNQKTGEILFLAFLGSSTLKSSDEFSKYIEQLEKIEFDKGKAKDNNIQNWEFSIWMLKFWEGEKVDLNNLKENMYLDPFLRLCINYDNNEISYDDFLTTLDTITYIPTSMILNWERLEKIFDKTNSYEWLKKVLNKAKSDDLNNTKLRKYISDFYQRAFNEEKVLLLNNFLELDMFIRDKYQYIIYSYYAVIIYTSIYNYYDNMVKDLILSVCDKFDELKENITDEKYMLEFIYSLVSFNISIKDDDIKQTLIKLITNDSLFEDKKILLYGLIYNDEELLNYYYDSIFDCVLKNYQDIANVSRDDYVIISQIAFNTMGIDNININLSKNKFFHDNNKYYILDKNYNKDLKGLYENLKIEKIDKKSIDMEEDNILYLITHRIFFANIEKMKAGKIIRTPSNATGKELLEILAKETGIDKIERDLDLIKAGKIVNQFWFNLFNMHNYFKNVYLMNNNLFSNSKNELIKVNNVLFHFSSLILAVKIGISDIIENDSRIFVTNSIFDDLMYQKAFEIPELTDGITEPLVNYDELFDKTCDLVATISDKKRVVEISSANILGIKNQDFLNKYDRDIFKFFANTIGQYNDYFVITEDPFYYSADWFNQRSFGIYSYIIEKYISGDIKSDRLLEITNKLRIYNYGFNISDNLYKYLVEKADDENIDKIVDIIKKDI
ncbi:MAG: hypothetical protein PHG18_02775 [Bacilli bacterium]|nr:hypothetical protein [Bacilli bacterium]